MDAKARLDGIAQALSVVIDAVTRVNAQSSSPYDVAVSEAMCRARAHLNAEGVTLPPQPAGPVTSEGTADTIWATWLASTHVVTGGKVNTKSLGIAIDTHIARIAEDHGLLTPAEVERRAREWWDGRNYAWSDSAFADLIAALTREAK